MKRFLTAAVFFFTLAAGILPGQDRNTSFDYYMEGVHRYCSLPEHPDRDKSEEAIRLFRKAIELDPENDAAYYYMGLCRFKEQNTEEAVRYLKKASELDPGNFWYKVLIARLYAHLGENDMAIHLYEGLIADFPQKYTSYYELLDIYMRNKNLRKSYEYLDRIETMRGMDEMTANARYSLLMAEGKTEEALKVLLDLNRQFPSPVTSFMIGDIYKAQFKDTLALDYYDRSLALSPEYSPAYFGRAEIYRMRMDMNNFFKNIYVFMSSDSFRPEMKVEYLNQAVVSPNMVYSFKPQLDSLMQCLISAHPYDTTVSNYSGMYYIATGDTLKGLDQYTGCIAHHPESDAAHFNYLSILYQLQMWKPLITAAQDFQKIKPDDLSVMEIIAVANWQDGQLDNAIHSYLKMIESVPKGQPMLVNICSALGDLYQLKGNLKKAYRYYEKGLKIDGNSAIILNNYAYNLSLEGKHLDKALEMSRKTIVAEPDNFTYLDTFGWILYLKGEYQEAKAILKKAIAKGGKESAAIMDHYADILYALGDFDLALLYWSDAAKLDPTLGISDKIAARKKELGKE